MIAYITKYALTKGILEVVAEETNTEMLVVRKTHCVSDYYHGKDWHRDLEDARKQADAMRYAKIASLKRQITKLQKKEFW